MDARTRTAIDTRALEALLFVSDEPLPASVLAQALEIDRRTVEALVRPARARASRSGVAAWCCATSPAGGGCSPTPTPHPVVERFVLSSRQARLTKAALETLAIVAYKQPVTRHQVSGDPRRELRRGPARARRTGA